MGEKHFEIIMSGRQMTLVIAAVVGLLLVAFGLGVTVGLLEPGGGSGQSAQSPAPVVPAEPELVPAPFPDAWTGLPQQAQATPALEEPAGLPEPSPAGEPSPGATAASTVAPAPAPTPAPTPAPALAPATLAAPPPSPRPTVGVGAAAGIWIQVGSLSQAQQGEGLKLRVVAMGFAPDQVVVVRAADGRYRVRVGPFPDEESAGRVIARIRTQGLPDAFLVRD